MELKEISQSGDLSVYLTWEICFTNYVSDGMTPMSTYSRLPTDFCELLQALDKYFSNKQVHFLLEERRIKKYDNDPEKHHDLRDRFALVYALCLACVFPLDIFRAFRIKNSVKVLTCFCVPGNFVDNIVTKKRNKKLLLRLKRPS